MPIKLKPLKKIKTEIVAPPKKGEILTGKVVATDRSSVFLDLGSRGIGVIRGMEFQRARSIIKKLKKGEELSAKLIETENEEGYRELSLIEARKQMIWQKLRERREANEVFEVKIKKANKGGLIADVEGISAFLPVSQLSPENYPKVKQFNSAKIARHLQEFTGKTLKVKILDMDSRKEKLILTEKTAESEKENKAASNLKEGDEVEGKIAGITNFGTFVEIGENIEALLPSGEYKNKKIKEGEKIKGKIKKIENNRVYLSLS